MIVWSEHIVGKVGDEEGECRASEGSIDGKENTF